MVRFIKLLIVGIAFLFSSLMAVESPLIEPEVAVKMIGNNSTQFIMAEKNSMEIIGSQHIDIAKLYKGDVFGHIPCKPFYICPNDIRDDLERLGIKSNQELILYDNHNGVYASTLYMVLESIGHRNMKIFNGGLISVEKLDPNRRIYNKYSSELMEITSFIQQENNVTTNKKLQEKSLELEEKLTVLKPFLLVQKKKNIPTEKAKSSYKIEKDRFDFNHFVGEKKLHEAVQRLRNEGKKSNISIVDACSMMDIVGNKYGSYQPGVNSVDWKEIVNHEKRGFKSHELLEKIFAEAGLKKENTHYVYCMSGSAKAFYLSMALRSVGYNKVKAFIGEWSAWTGDSVE